MSQILTTVLHSVDNVDSVKPIPSAALGRKMNVDGDTSSDEESSVRSGGTSVKRVEGDPRNMHEFFL